MTSYALESLLSPLDGESPTGQNLEYDAEFLALERLASPKSERAMGDSVKAAEEPDWDRVSSQAESLLGRSKDLRIAVHLIKAWMRTTGMPGFAAGLRLLKGLLENFWDGVHPQLDAEDDNDPTARVNAISAVTDLQGMLGFFRNTPFVQSPRLGRFSLRDLRIANGTLKVAGSEQEEVPEQASMSQIEACCMDCPEEQLTDTVAAIGAALDDLKAIDAIFSEHIGTAGPDLKPLLSDIFEVKKFLEPQLARRSPQAAGGDTDAEGAGEAGEASSSGGKANHTGRIEGPQDVIRRIDDICEYYARCEPSSPIPLLLRRAQRLVGLSFVDLMKDLAPGGVSELQVISGSTDE
ncbi:MAG TPA: type VI secretion system protein TssA [Dyella sp.]|uniref:type VI secretion system protein TssA n=1 Tax=Dyella sp. TaxID=1869338 RepID=UPI002BFCF268|nr:type VI secretion system protein TssA [Dyella sp.]HTV87127.1 type VI secretion system protein TssA [Dyella sp.]